MSLRIRRSIESAYTTIVYNIKLLGYDVLDGNFKNTPERCARAFDDFIYPKKNIEQNLRKFFKAKFKDNTDEMIIATDISVVILCPHHLLPAKLKVWLAYIPNGEVLGLSKLIRIAQMLGHQPILQEAYATQLAETVRNNLTPKGVGVYIKGEHGCMSFRGVRTTESRIITTKLLGAFKDQPATRSEFLSQCRKD